MSDAKPNVQSQVNDDEIEDPVESMLKKTGCIELHYKVQVSRPHLLCFNFFLQFFLLFSGVYR